MARIGLDDDLKQRNRFGDQESLRVLKRSRRGHYDHGGHGKGVTGPLYTYIKTDSHGNFKWGARHNVGKHMRYG